MLCFWQVVEHGLGHLPFTEKQVITPTGEAAGGEKFQVRKLLVPALLPVHQRDTDSDMLRLTL